MDIFDFKQFNQLLASSLEAAETQHYLKQLAGLSTLFTSNSRELPGHLRCFNPPHGDWNQLILFPGTFSPWHLGHQACVEGCAPYPVFILPDDNPWKDERKTAAWDDFKAIYHYILNSKKEGTYLYPGFLTREESNPTVTWLPQLPLKTKRLLMGDDTFLSIHKWKEAPKLLSALDEIYVCPRQGNMDELTKQFDFLNQNYHLKITFLDAHDYENLSSTEIRSTVSGE